MQEPTHILAGVIIEIVIRRLWGRRAVATAVAAFLSHGLLDRLANATYHPPQADFTNPFWVIFHSCVLVFTILFLYLWWRRFKWGVTFAMLPDLDWVIIHGQHLLGVRIWFYQTPHMHRLLGLVFDKMPPFSSLQVPNHRQNPWACLWEIGLVLVMLAAIRIWAQRRRRGIFVEPNAKKHFQV